MSEPFPEDDRVVLCDHIWIYQRFLDVLAILARAKQVTIRMLFVAFLVEKHPAVQKRLKYIPIRQLKHSRAFSHSSIK